MNTQCRNYNFTGGESQEFWDPSRASARLAGMETPKQLRERAKDCRSLATEADNRTASNLIMLAEEYEAQADRLESEPATPEA